MVVGQRGRNVVELVSTVFRSRWLALRTLRLRPVSWETFKATKNGDLGP